MAKARHTTREEATADLRVAFAELYNELRRRGHAVVVAYDEPGNPLYIPRFVELDGLKSDELNVRFFIEPHYRDDRQSLGTGYRGHYYGVIYIPSLTARRSYSMTQKKRTQLHSKNQLSGSAMADWVEKLLDVEKRSKDLVTRNSGQR